MSAAHPPEGAPRDPALPPAGEATPSAVPEAAAGVEDALTQLARQLFADSGAVPEWIHGRGQPGRPPARWDARPQRTSSGDTQDT